jgi:predicted SnoaL-like aldol condensation-catalyzing enzyme
MLNGSQSKETIVVKQVLAAGAACVALCMTCVVATADEASQAGPAKGVSAAQMEKNKEVVRAFFKPGVTGKERYDLLDDGYIQHNPGAKKMADDMHVSYKEGFRQMLDRMGGNFPTPPTQVDGAPVPPGNMTYMVLAEGDLVFVMSQQYRRDPTVSTSVVFYPAYTWDVFRVRNGKLYEHWDGATINMRPPGGGPGGPPGGAPGGPPAQAPAPPK